MRVMCGTHVLAVLLTFYIADPLSVIVRRYAPSVYALFLRLLFNSSVPQSCQILFQTKIICPRVHRVTPEQFTQSRYILQRKVTMNYILFIQ